jgi:hypothetical protein
MSQESRQPDQRAESGTCVFEAEGLTDLQTGEFLIRVRVAAVNPVDRKMCHGELRLVF